MATLRENAQYFRQIVRERMSQMFASITYYRRIFFEQSLILAKYVLTKIGQGFRFGYKAMRFVLHHSYLVAKWILFNLPYELLQFTSFVFRQIGDFLFDLFTIIKPCIKWLAKHSLNALWKLLGVCLGVLMALGDLGVEGIKFVLRHTVGILFPSLFAPPAQRALTKNVVSYDANNTIFSELKLANGFTPHYQRALPTLSPSLFPDELSEKRASLTP